MVCSLCWVMRALEAKEYKRKSGVLTLVLRFLNCKVKAIREGHQLSHLIEEKEAIALVPREQYCMCRSAKERKRL